MTDNEFIHNPEGIIIFDEPTDLTVHFGAAQSSVTVRVLPYSLFREGEVWAGADTYTIPEDAEYTILKDIDLDDVEISPNDIDNNEVSFAQLTA